MGQIVAPAHTLLMRSMPTTAARYIKQRCWTSKGTPEAVREAITGDAARHWRWHISSDQEGHIEIRVGSKSWFFLVGGLATPNFLVPMRIAIDLIAQTESLVEITASASSDLPVWFLPRPGDRGRYEDAFDAQLRNLIQASSSC